jgi:hypothetical protein
MKRELESLSDVEDLLNNGIPENSKNSCRRLYEAYLLAYRMLRDEISTRTGGAETDDPVTPLNVLLVSAEQCQVAADHIQRCFQHFTRHSLVVKIEITDWLEAFELFDGLNNRGMELAKREVLKNVLFSRFICEQKIVSEKPSSVSLSPSGMNSRTFFLNGLLLGFSDTIFCSQINQ